MAHFPLLLVAALLGAQSTAQFRVETAQGEPIVGMIQNIAADWSVRLGEGKSIYGRDVIALRRVGTVLPAWPREPQLVFANGDRLAGEVVESDGKSIRFRPAMLGRNDPTISVPLSRASILWLRSPPGESPDSDPRHLLLHGTRKRDALLMRNGDTLTGDLLGISGSAVRLQTGQEQSVPRSKVAAVAFNTELARSRPPKGKFARAVFADGSFMTLVSATVNADGLSGETDFKESIKVPWSKLIAIDLFQGRAVYLSDLKPKRYEFTPFLSERHPWVADRNVHLRQIAVRFKDGVSHFNKGIGLHSRCALIFGLDKKYSRFEALIGLDEYLGENGAVSVRVSLDGKESSLPDLKRLTYAGGGQAVRLDVSGASEMTIEIDWGEGGHIGDVVNFADARLILAR